MKLGAREVLIPVQFASTFQVFYGRRIRVICVELADRIGADV
jgi:hypothetical protein